MNDSENKLQSEILGDAERRAERLTKRARRDAAKELDAVREEHDTEAAERLEEARKRADERRRAITAGIDHDIKQRWLTMREERLEALFSEVLEQTEHDPDIDRKESVRQLLTEALAAIGPTAVRVRAHADYAAILDDELIAAAAEAAWNESTRDRVTVEEDESLAPGIVVQSADGRRRFDNRYATRMIRLHSTLRALVATTPAKTRENDTTHA